MTNQQSSTPCKSSMDFLKLKLTANDGEAIHLDAMGSAFCLAALDDIQGWIEKATHTLVGLSLVEEIDDPGRCIDRAIALSEDARALLLEDPDGLD